MKQIITSAGAHFPLNPERREEEEEKKRNREQLQLNELIFIFTAATALNLFQ